MNKKILAWIIVIVLVVAGGIFLVNNNTKKDNDKTDNAVTEENKDTDDTNNTENLESTNNTTTDKNTTNDQDNSNTDIDALAKSETATNNDEAVKKLLDFYLGEDDQFVANTVKVTLNTNSDNTIAINKTDSDSNIYYAGISPLSDTSTEGLIITIENYNDSDKTYTYSIKELSAVKSGDNTNIVDNGTIPQDGNVISTKNQK